MTADLAAYFGLFGAAFLAATILPAQSEAVLAMMILAERYPLAILIGIASLGNVLGSIVGVRTRAVRNRTLRPNGA